MTGPSSKPRIIRQIFIVAPLALVAGSMSAAATGPQRLTDPMRFFEGRTEMVSTVKLTMKKPYRSRTIGRGEIAPDGTLHLVQRVQDEGRGTHDRRWRIHQVAPGRFSGTMSEAKGPVTVEEINGRYRFRFKMKGSLSIEQWLTPLRDGRSARSKIIIRKLGMNVGHSEGMVHKL